MSCTFYFKNKTNLLEMVEGNLLHDEFKVKGALAFWPDVPGDQEYVLQAFSELYVQPTYS